MEADSNYNLYFVFHGDNARIWFSHHPLQVACGKK